MGRKKVIGDNDVLCVTTQNARTRLQQNSDRRAMVNTIIDAGGKMTLTQLNASYGYDCRTVIGTLATLGWIAVVKEEAP